MESQRNTSEFVLLGLSYDQNVQIFCFVLFLFCYVALLAGNLLILVSIRCSPLFHQPMYYFLSHLSCMDICYTSSVTPKFIADLRGGTKTISYGNCMFQVFAMHFFGSTEVFVLTVMAFDRYVAICKPLHYLLIMNRTRCNLLVLAAWAGGALHSLPQLSMTIQLPFCGPNEIDHYFCDILPLLKVACTDTYITGVLVVANSGLVALVTFVVLFVSYVIILFSLRHRSAEGRHKALSTCGSHITVVILFFGPSIFAYLRPPTTFPQDKIFALFYTIIAPMFNPLIYTLRNTEMKSAMRKVWCQTLFSKEAHN
ncbi:olfactory receptor 4P4-like [Panthera pardus]|uniref:Olfactory receptor n=1 Tax=Panthera pardus TaxID=9691 RepID=A0A9V1DV39_PANPR|nr:olfactory receptor 4P4-like [Panthera pardus]XP_023094783.1 olfactory receptor 4P4-like [Felis catus]XP_042761916.1 olfactory receptor 4P4-like [Panthera leo]XP_058546624.1 olfactory receptor 4P4-like [Neofelis nebulosa]